MDSERNEADAMDMMDKAADLMKRAALRIEELEAENAHLEADNELLTKTVAEQKAEIERLKQKDIDASWALNPERMGR